MSNAARVTGTVLKVETRSGSTRNTPDGQPRAWSMTSARVLVADEDICDVGIPDAFAETFGRLGKGQEVDLFVSVRVGKGGFLNIDAVKPWPAGLSAVPAPASASSSASTSGAASSR